MDIQFLRLDHKRTEASISFSWITLCNEKLASCCGHIGSPVQECMYEVRVGRNQFAIMWVTQLGSGSSSLSQAFRWFQALNFQSSSEAPDITEQSQSHLYCVHLKILIHRRQEIINIIVILNHYFGMFCYATIGNKYEVYRHFFFKNMP